MATLQRVDHDPFAASPAKDTPKTAKRPTVTPVAHDPFAAPKPVAARPTRSWGEAASDTGRALASGVGQVIKGAGTLGALATGTGDNAMSRFGDRVSEYWQEGQSEALKQQKMDRSAAIDAADGMLAKAGTAIKETVTSPALLVDTVAETAASMLPAGAAARVGSVLGAGRAAARGATAAQAATQGARVGTGAAIGTGAAQAGADVAGGVFDESMQLDDAAWQRNADFVSRVAAGEDPSEVKRDLSVRAARAGFAMAVPLSLATQAIPGGATIERAIAGATARTGAAGGVVGRGLNAVRGAAGEAAQEALEEGGGQFVGNVAQQQFVDPSTELTAGVGESAGMGAVGGGGLGGVAGGLQRVARRPQAEVRPAGDITRAVDPAAEVVTTPAPVIPDAAPGSISDAANAVASARVARRPQPAAAPVEEVKSSPAEQDELFAATIPPSPSTNDAAPAARMAPDAGEIERRRGELSQQLAAAREQGSNTAMERVLQERAAFEANLGESGQAPAAAPIAPRVPWLDVETGEYREPSDAEIEGYIHDQFNQQMTGGRGINTRVVHQALSEAGLPAKRRNTLLTKVKADRRQGITSAPGVEAPAAAASPPLDASQRAAVVERIRSADTATDELRAELGASESLGPRDASRLYAEIRGVPVTRVNDAVAAIETDETGRRPAIAVMEAARQARAGQQQADTTAPAASARVAGAPALAEAAPAPDAAPPAAERPRSVSAPGQELGAPSTGIRPSVESAPAGAAQQSAPANPVQAAASEAATSPANDRPDPTPAQREAGNYKVGRLKVAGLDVSVEYPPGVKRDPAHDKALTRAYGRIRRTEGADGEHVDVFLGDRADDPSLPVFVVDQYRADGGFDEHKAVMGEADEASARAAYLSNYPDDWTGLGGIRQMSQAEFKSWVRDPKATKKPAASAKAVAVAEPMSDAEVAALRDRNQTPPAVPGDTWDTAKVLRDKPVGGVAIIEGEPTPQRPDGGVRWTKLDADRWSDGDRTVSTGDLARMLDRQDDMLEGEATRTDTRRARPAPRTTATPTAGKKVAAVQPANTPAVVPAPRGATATREQLEAMGVGGSVPVKGTPWNKLSGGKWSDGNEIIATDALLRRLDPREGAIEGQAVRVADPTPQEQWADLVGEFTDAQIEALGKAAGLAKAGQTTVQLRRALRKADEARVFPVYEQLAESRDWPSDEGRDSLDDLPPADDEWDYEVANFPVPDRSVDANKTAGPFITPAQAADRLREWKAEAKRIGREEDHSNDVIISLFDATGEISKPWREAGYDVLQYDIKLGDDLLEQVPMADLMEIEARGKRVVGVIAQPPCTCFTSSGARWWSERHDVHDRKMVAKMFGARAAKYFSKPKEYTRALVALTDLVIGESSPLFWAVENPVGRIASQVGLPKPTLKFDPHVYGNPYTKRTQLWGRFNADLPTANVEPTQGSLMHKLWSTAEKDGGTRSITPEGFAYAFFMANKDVANANAGTEQAAGRATITPAALRAPQRGSDARERDGDSALNELDSEAVEELLTRHGEAVENDVARDKRWNEGDHFFAVHEMAEGEPALVTSMQMLRSYGPDSLMAVRRSVADAWLQERGRQESAAAASAPSRRSTDEDDAPIDLADRREGGWSRVANDPEAATPHQKRLMAAVREVLEDKSLQRDGVLYNDVLDKEVRKRVRFSDAALAVKMNVERGATGYEIYQARRAVENHIAMEADAGAQKRRAFKEGDVFKNVRLGEGAPFSTVTVTAVTGDGRVSFSAKRRGSPKTWTGTTGAGTLDAAVPSAERKERSTSARRAPVPGVAPRRARAVRDEAPAVAPANTEDAGEELWANRRNRTGAGLQWSDIEGLNATLKVKEAVKTKVWPRPDYEALTGDGMPPVLAHLVKLVYDKVATKPAVRGAASDEQLRQYIEGVSATREATFEYLRALDTPAFRAALTKDDGVAIAQLMRDQRSVLDRVFPSPDPQRRFRGNPENNALALLLGGNKLVQAMQLGRADIETARRAVAAGWPAPQEAWERQFTIREAPAGAKMRRDGKDVVLTAPEFYVTGLRNRRIFADGLATREAAVEKARELASARRGAGPSDAEKAIAVEEATRTGAPRRAADKDVTSDEFKEAFGFRGVNFGNWMKGDSPAKRRERQLHLNHAYDSFADLAEILDVPARALSLNGTLGLAFGAQGHGGGAAAHFVPGVNEINLTRENGVGSLAHEWAHALDHYFAVQSGDKYAKREEPFLSHLAQLGRLESDTLRPEIAQAFAEIVRVMTKRDLTAEEVATRGRAVESDATERLDRELKVIRDRVEAIAKPEARRQLLQTWDQLASRAREGDLGEGYVEGRSMRTTYRPVVAQLRGLVREAGVRMSVDGFAPLAQAADRVAYAVKTRAEDADHRPQTTSSDYYREAGKLDAEKRRHGGRYWRMPTELLARAFQSYVMDRLATREARNDYLTRPQMSAEDRQILLAGPLAPLAEAGDRYPRGAERERINEAFDALVATMKTRDGEDGGVALYSRRGWDESFPDAVVGHRLGVVQAHPAYAAAKGGNTPAAQRLASDVVTDDYVAAVRAALPAGERPIVVPVLAPETTGNNRIPQAAARVLAQKLGLKVSDDIVQATRVGRGGAGGIARLGRQPRFAGEVVPGQAYLLLDDTLTQGGTFAQLKTHIEDRGGRVLLATALTGKEYSRKIALTQDTQNALRERFSPIEGWWRDTFGYGFEGFTESEARFLLGLRGDPSPDAVRDRIIAGGLPPVGGGDGRVLRSASDSTPSAVDAPPSAGRSTSGLSIARAQQLKSQLTARWGDNAPRVILVESAAELQRAAGLPQTVLQDPDFYRAEGLYRGKPAVWINLEQIRTEERFGQVLAHEALGHYGVERVVGEEQWAQIAGAIASLERNGLGSAQLRGVLRDVRARYGSIDTDTFAREAIAVMAERGIRNSYTGRVIAAVRRFLRQWMPSMRWSERDVIGLLTQAESFLHEGRSATARARLIQANAFSRADPADGQQVDEVAIDDALIAGLSPAERRSGPMVGLAAALWEDMGTQSPFFRAWFGDSKVVDDKGQPLKVYHGTAEEFAAFDAARAGKSTGHMTARLGMFFDARREKAAHYARVASNDVPAEQQVLELHLSIQNPYPMSKAEFMGIDGTDRAEALRARLEREGYDGIRLPDIGQWIAFRPDQIKSTSNRGSFDPTDARMLFSKAATPADVIDDVEAVMDSTRSEGALLDRARAALKAAVPKKLKDRLRPTWLGALTTRHLTELGNDYFGTMRIYSDYLAEMGADRNQLATEGEGIAEDARKWAGKNRTEAQALFRLMHDATIQGVDPAEEYQPLQFQYGSKVREATRANIKLALEAIREQMRGRSGDNKTDMLAEAKMLRGMPAREKQRKAHYPGLVERWAALSPEAQAHYLAMRDLYKKRSGQVEDALVARIKDADVPENHKRKIINTIRMQFEAQRLQGVYFPLQRFGRYFVAAERDGTPTFLMFENLDQLERAVKDLRGRGFEIKAQGLKGEQSAKDAPSGTFVAEVIQTLHNAGVSNQTQDQIYQLYLQALPELSIRKHMIHRQSVPGFDPDAVRAFAYNMHHGAHQLAKLRYAHKLQDVLDVLRKQQEGARREPGADTRRIAAGDAILDELARRHEWISNPQDSALTNLVSSFGFVYYLGLTPAAALVNLSQTAIVTYPYLASRFGAVKAMNYLLAAGRDAGRTLGNIQKTLTNPEEQRAHQVLQAMGALDKTQAHNLAGIAEGGMAGYNPAWSKAMEWIGVLFHKTEVMNRETSGIAAYRLARADGMSFDAAVKFAADAIFDTHYDYSNANRARFMQSGTAKVLLMFRQYSLNTTWHLGRMLWQATKGESPEVRALARRNLTGILGMTALFSGTMGLPVMGVVMGTLNAIAASFGDDDEPWEAETEFRRFLADMLGADAAGVVLEGAANAVTGADIASRVSMSQLWFRDADRELEGRGAYYHLLEQAAGPMGGVLKNALVGKQLMDDGHLWRGVETVLPKSLKDVMKAGRFATEGANNLRGDALVEDLGVWNALLQLNGFTPDELSDQYDQNRRLKNYEQHILNRRRYLLDAFAMANRTGDEDGRRDALRSIDAFNTKFPELRVTPQSIRKSLLSRARYSEQAEGGITLNRRLAARAREAAGVE